MPSTPRQQSPTRAPKLYTRAGDGGHTRGGCEIVCKSNDLPEALGEIDELNSWLGHIATVHPEEASSLRRIQRQLMNLSSRLHGVEVDARTAADIAWLEAEIDRMTCALPVLTGFILPQGEIHIARAVCRRAERAAVRFVAPSSSLSAPGVKECLSFLNRLSDYLFTVARVKHQPDLLLRGGERDAAG